MLNIRPIYPTSWRIETQITVQARLRVGECLVFRPKLLSCQIVFFRNLHKLYLAAQNMWNILKLFVLNLKLYSDPKILSTAFKYKTLSNWD